MAKASSNDILGLGKPLTGGHPSVLKSHKTREGASRTSVLKPHKTSQGASRSMAKASSNDILGLGKPLRSGQGAIRQFWTGAIRQFWNPIKPAMAPGAAWLKPAPTVFEFPLFGSDILGLGKPLRSGQGAIRQSREGASGSMAKASSNDILGLGKPLGSGPGAIRQFWKPIKLAMAPAAAWLKPAPTTFWAWGSLWDRDRGPSVSFEIP